MTPGWISVPAGPNGAAVAVVEGPVLLRGPLPGTDLYRHRSLWPAPVRAEPHDLLAALDRAKIMGRGGAAFPFARKVRSALDSGRVDTVVVNGAEGEPGSSKDAALLMAAPHVVLDGAALVAGALGVREVRVVVGAERPRVSAAVAAAVAGRRDPGVRFRVATADGGFVGGQSSAVLELLAGRADRPVTRWEPATVGSRTRRGTLLSNAETFAHAAAAWTAPGAFAEYGTPDEPGTTLVTVGGDGIVDRGTPTVAEVEQRIPLYGVVPEAPDGRGPVGVLLGGYHGQWLPWPESHAVPLSHRAPPPAPRIGAGVVLPLRAGGCPVATTADVVDFLAAARAGQCGPCEAGLPDLARSTRVLARGGRGAARAADDMLEVAALVTGRGACAHPDGTARLVTSLVAAFPDEVDAHRHGTCAARGRAA